MSTESTLHPGSFLAQVCRKEPLTGNATTPLVRQLPFFPREEAAGQPRSTTATLISVDTGNDALKGALLHTHQHTR